MQSTKKQPPKKQEPSSSEDETDSDREMDVGGKKKAAESSESEGSSEGSGDQEDGVGLKLGVKRQRPGTLLYPQSVARFYLVDFYRFKQQFFLKTAKNGFRRGED